MRTFEALIQDEFSQSNRYLSTASNGLLPAHVVAAMRTSIESMAAGRLKNMFEGLEAARSVFARLAGGRESRIAADASVGVHARPIAASLPAGPEVLTAEGDFASTVSPFHIRGDLRGARSP